MQSVLDAVINVRKKVEEVGYWLYLDQGPILKVLLVPISRATNLDFVVDVFCVWVRGIHKERFQEGFCKGFRVEVEGVDLELRVVDPPKDKIPPIEDPNQAHLFKEAT